MRAIDDAVSHFRRTDFLEDRQEYSRFDVTPSTVHKPALVVVCEELIGNNMTAQAKNDASRPDSGAQGWPEVYYI